MTPETIQVLGTVATLYGLGGAFSVLFQARQMHSRGSSGDVSARFFGVYVGGFAVWLLYGLGIGSVPIIVVHAVGLLCGAITLAVVLRLRRPAAVASKTRLAGESGTRRPSRGARARADGILYRLRWRAEPAQRRSPGIVNAKRERKTRGNGW